MTMDDPFFDIVQGIEIEEPVDVLNVRTLASNVLVSKFNELTQALLDREEILNPHTQEARDIHSLRNAVDVELQRRFRDPSQHIEDN